jgi:hypothetical protein
MSFYARLFQRRAERSKRFFGSGAPMTERSEVCIGPPGMVQKRTASSAQVSGPYHAE